MSLKQLYTSVKVLADDFHNESAITPLASHLLEQLASIVEAKIKEEEESDECS